MASERSEKAVAAHAESGAQSAASAQEGMPAWRFRLIAVAHYRAVYRFARALLHGDREAEDVTQEAFMQLWRQSVPIERPREWLLAVARNACLDRFRRSAGRLVEAEPPEQSDDRDPEWHYGQRELAERLARCIAALPEPQRSLIVLFDAQGHDGATCARMLGLNVNQVKVYLHRARRRLRQQLEQSS